MTEKRGVDEHEPSKEEMAHVLVVSENLSIEQPEDKLERYFSSEFELFDRLPARPDNRVRLFDILASVLVNSMVNTSEKVSTIWNDRAGIEEALARIPRDAALLSDEVPWTALEELLRAALEVKFVRLAVATKILHKKRPHLLPIVDSYLEKYYRSAYPDVTEPGLDDVSRCMRIIRHFRDELNACRQDLEKLMEIPRRRRCRVSLVRLLEVLIWIEKEGSGRFRGAEEQ